MISGPCMCWGVSTNCFFFYNNNTVGEDKNNNDNIRKASICKIHPEAPPSLITKKLIGSYIVFVLLSTDSFLIQNHTCFAAL